MRASEQAAIRTGTRGCSNRVAGTASTSFSMSRGPFRREMRWEPGKGWDQDRFRRVLPIVLRCERWVMSHVLHATACKYADMSTASFSPCLRSPLGPFITTTPSSTGPRIGREAQPLISGVLLPAREGVPERDSASYLRTHACPDFDGGGGSIVTSR